MYFCLLILPFLQHAKAKVNAYVPNAKYNLTIILFGPNFLIVYAFSTLLAWGSLCLSVSSQHPSAIPSPIHPFSRIWATAFYFHSCSLCLRQREPWNGRNSGPRHKLQSSAEGQQECYQVVSEEKKDQAWQSGRWRRERMGWAWKV